MNPPGGNEADLHRARIAYGLLFLVVFVTGLALAVAWPFIAAGP